MTAAVLIAALLATGPPGEPVAPVLRIHLPRVVAVQTGPLRLGAVAVIVGDDQALVEKARAVAMGRSPWPRERIVLNRPTILGRLAASGIRAGDVKLTGAAEVAVVGKQTIVAPEQIHLCAEAHLRAHPPAPAGSAWKLVRPAKELVLDASGPVELHARPGEGAPDHHVKVRVAARIGQKEMGATEVLFRLAYPTRRAVVTRPIEPGEMVTQQNARVETVLAAAPPEPSWTAPFGRVAVMPLREGTVIRPALVRSPTAPLLVRRGQSVVMRIEGPGFSITGLGQALQDGRAGDHVKVRNLDSKRVIVARVAFDGTVEPVFEEKKP